MSKKRIINLAAFLGLLLLTAGTPLHAKTTTWDGSAANWNESHWDNGVPQVGDDVVISSGTVTLSNATPALTSLTMGGGTLSFTNWSTKLTATTVTINSGTLTHGANSDTNAPWTPDARVWIVCSNLAVNGGSIDVDLKGYGGGAIGNSGFGPGAGLNGTSAGSHGGFGGATMAYSYPAHYNSLPYDSAMAPVEPGSGGGGGNNGPGGDGGGVVRIEANHATINGTITAKGGFSGANHTSGGSGGSIYISCSTFSGTNSTLSANGGVGNSSIGVAGSGGGGRIALVYDTELQQAEDVQNVQFTVKPGDIISLAEQGDIGTLYFSDNTLLGDNITALNGQLSEVSAWSPATLTISNSWIRFPKAGMTLTVAGNLTLEGSDGQLQIGGTRVENMYHVVFFGEPQLSALKVGGNMVLTNGGRFTTYAGSTNASTVGYGALVDVTGDISLASNSIFALHSDPTNGASVLVRCNDLTLAQGAMIDALGRGWAGDSTEGQGAGWGPGGGAYKHGGTFGGRDGYPGGPAPYGSSNAPALPGSGGGSSSYGPGGAGGGLARIDADGDIFLNGTINASGGDYGGNHSSGGSGGGILMVAEAFTGTGAMTADGGNGYSSAAAASGGGGGRIAIWYGSYTEADRTEILNGQDDQIPASYQSLGETTFSGSASVEGGYNTYSTGSYTGGVGTVVFRYYVSPPSGTMILIQ